jgi:hypothetical protein
MESKTKNAYVLPVFRGGVSVAEDIDYDMTVQQRCYLNEES